MRRSRRAARPGSSRHGSPARDARRTPAAAPRASPRRGAPTALGLGQRLCAPHPPVNIAIGVIAGPVDTVGGGWPEGRVEGFGDGGKRLGTELTADGPATEQVGQQVQRLALGRGDEEIGLIQARDPVPRGRLRQPALE